MAATGITATRDRSITTIQLAAPGLIFLAMRAIGLLILELMAAGSNVTIPKLLSAWDGQWYLGIADNGYAGVPAQLTDAHGLRTPDTALAFFPGYPFGIHALSSLGIGSIAAAVLLSTIAGMITSYGLVRIGELIPHGSRTVGLILVALFATAPLAIVLSMAYSEGLFCAFAVWALVFMMRRQWIYAGLCSTFSGLIRPTAGAVVLAVGLAALVCVIKDWRQWRAWVGGLLAPVGLVGYVGLVGAITGSPTGYFTLQSKGWDAEFDWGASTLKFVTETLTTPRQPLEVITSAVIIAALVLLGVCIKMRLPWPLLVYSVATVVIDLATNGLMGVKGRWLIPAFTLLIPIAVALAKRRSSTALATLAGLTIFSGWLGGYALLVWPYAI